MFSTLRKSNFNFLVTFILSIANAFNLDQSRFFGLVRVNCGSSDKICLEKGYWFKIEEMLVLNKKIFQFYSFLLTKLHALVYKLVQGCYSLLKTAIN